MSCKIVLDAPGILSPGSTMYGRVVCTFSSNTYIKEIRCKLRGTETTSVRHGKSTYVGSNRFLDLRLRLLGESSLQSGVYEYPFYFPLPAGIPSSFEGEWGSITYTLKAVVDMPLAFNYKDKFTLTVTVPIDFNKIRRELQLMPIVHQNEKIVCCWCCASEPITINLFLEKDAFVLGEMAKVNVEITNWSNTNVEEFILTLNRVTMYHCELEGARHTKEQELIGFQNATGVGAHGKRTYTVNFQIPTTISVYNLTPCQLIKQIFILRAEAVLPICHQNLTVDAEIKLGHIGLHDNNSTQETNLGFEDLEGANYDTPPRYSALF
ncbi:arrestin domain-containing protein 4-like isoform X1 [Diabrotica undecimpunctata]|uniref:arrestin domain-containing protein 4-like isoform X1 n=1 Tax=Diabrotica undecimpunctata TaxID=50387 RepID=UPI003B639F26